MTQTTNNTEIMLELISIMKNVKFRNNDLEYARKESAHSFHRAKKSNDLTELHADLSAMLTIYQVQRRNMTTKNGTRILPPHEIAIFFDKAQKLETVLNNMAITA